MYAFCAFHSPQLGQTITRLASSGLGSAWHWPQTGYQEPSAFPPRTVLVAEGISVIALTSPVEPRHFTVSVRTVSGT